MYDVCKAWNAVWDDNGGLGPSAGKGWYAEKTGDFNTANILMGNGPAGFDEIFGTTVIITCTQYSMSTHL